MKKTTINQTFKNKILLVDDEELHLQSLSILITQHGYDIDTASSGEEAIEKITSEKYGVLLLDLNMNEISGDEVMDFIKTNNINTTVIVVSGETSFEAAKNAFKHGAYDFIRKPYAIENLLNSVDNAIKSRQLVFDNLTIQEKLKGSEKLHRYIVNKSPDIVYMLTVYALLFCQARITILSSVAMKME